MGLRVWALVFGGLGFATHQKLSPTGLLPALEEVRDALVNAGTVVDFLLQPIWGFGISDEYSKAMFKV